MDIHEVKADKLQYLRDWYTSIAVFQPKVQVGMHVQQKFNSVCASARPEQSLSFSPEATFAPRLPTERPSETMFRAFDGRICQRVPFAGQWLTLT